MEVAQISRFRSNKNLHHFYFFKNISFGFVRQKGRHTKRDEREYISKETDEQKWIYGQRRSK